MRSAYNWSDIAQRTEAVYDRIMSQRDEGRADLGQRLANLWDREHLLLPQTPTWIIQPCSRVLYFLYFL